MFISYYQVSFKNKGNLDYIAQRTSDGLWTDARFYEMLPEVMKTEKRIAVHNYRPDKDWKEQVEKFLTLSSGKGFKVLCGDYESDPKTEQSAKDFYCFLSRLKEKRPEKKIVFYTNLAVLKDFLMPHQGKVTEYGPINWYEFDLWLARYYVSRNTEGITTLHVDPQTFEPSLMWNDIDVYPEGYWTFWQYWADGNQKGLENGCGSRDTNLDVFNGTVEELNEYWNDIGGEPVEPVPEGIEERVQFLESLTHNMADEIDDLWTEVNRLAKGHTTHFDILISHEKQLIDIRNEIEKKANRWFGL